MTAPVRDAATVVLLREGPSGLQTWLLTRVPEMAFAAGMSVFPGGRVDAADAALPIDDVDVASAAFDGDERERAAWVGAAARELFEETGVLLAEPAAAALAPEVLAARAAVEAHELPFADLLARHGLRLAVAGLRGWDRWITPEAEPRRYDARFFVAGLPPGAEALDVTGESSVAGWVDVSEALAQGERGERILMPPTMTVLRSLAGFSTVAEALAAAPREPVPAIMPTLHLDAERPYVTLPDGTTIVLTKRP